MLKRGWALRNQCWLHPPTYPRLWSVPDFATSLSQFFQGWLTCPDYLVCPSFLPWTAEGKHLDFWISLIVEHLHVLAFSFPVSLYLKKRRRERGGGRREERGREGGRERERGREKRSFQHHCQRSLSFGLTKRTTPFLIINHQCMTGDTYIAQPTFSIICCWKRQSLQIIIDQKGQNRSCRNKCVWDGGSKGVP